MIAFVAGWAAAAPVVHTATTELDRGSSAPLPVRATWPEGDGRLPVIVLSHGLGGSRDGLGPLAREWAAHGYLVLQPTHPDSLAFRTRAERRAFVVDPEGFAKDPQNVGVWDERPVEVGLVLDRLEWLRGAGLDPGRIDLDHVGIAGHSFGAHTAMLCAGLTIAGRSYAEPRADAVLLLSPQGTGAGITPASYGSIAVPTLMVTGSEDRSVRTGQGPAWRLEAWEGLTVPDRWLLWLDGATHELGGIGGRSAPDEEILGAVLEASTSFWDATLRGDAAARGRLEAGMLSHGGRRALLSTR